MFQMETLENIHLDGTPYFNDKKWVSPINYEAEIRGKFPEEIYIHDVTLRDGEQTPGVAWKEDERVMLAEELSELGVRRIEVGMPIVSPSIPRAIRTLLNRNLKSELVALCRAHKDDIDLCADIGLKSVIVEHTINPYLCRYALDLDVPHLIERLVTTVAYAKDKGMHTTFFGWDAFRTSIDYIQKVYGTVVKEAKPDAVTLVDTFGVALPDAVGLAVRKLREIIPDTPIEFHGHNEFGMGMGAVISAIQNGAVGIHCAINGLGERTGNVPTEEVAAALELLLGVKTGVNLSGLCRVSRLVAEMSKVPVPAGKPIVGPKLFDVESGLVTDIVYKMTALGVRTGMSPFVPEVVGGRPITYCIGKGSGKANVSHYLEKNGIKATKEQRKAILDQVKEEGLTRKGLLTEEDFLRIVGRVLSQSPEQTQPESEE